MAEYNPSKIIKDGNTYNFRDTTKIPLAGSNQISGDLIPSTDGTVNLGGSSYQWNNAYIKSLTINGVACGDILTHNASEFVPRRGGAVISGGLFRTDDDDTLVIGGGKVYTTGASIYMRGALYASEPGWIYLSPRSGIQTYKYMILKPDGSLTWNGTTIQYVSDKRLKQQISNIDDKLLDAWEDVNLVQFKYNDAVDTKGDTARLHTGYVVQQIDEACKSHNVDISEYGLYCHEEYPEETREVEHEDGTKTTEVVRPASEHYSLRYTEALIVECAFLRKKNKELQEQLNKLSARLDKLESASSK